MALFRNKKKNAEQTEAAATAGGGAAAGVIQPDVEDAIIEPRVTEKAAYAGERGVYVFNVRTDASKSEIARAIRRMYKVQPRKVNLAKVPGKQVRRRAHRGWRSGGKKAYVHLKKGDKIELM